MKTVAILLLALAAVGLVAVADAQTSNPSGSASGSVSTPSGSASGSTSGAAGSSSGSTSTTPGATSTSPGAPGADRPSVTAPAERPGGSGDGAALPRTATSDRTTIFGLSPTAAVVIAAALLVVVILAIVAMTRSNDTYIDTERRM
jgi:cobalamin biosynthesis Mg chelatase CobN